MRKTRLFLTVAFAAMLLSACGNKKQADELTTEQVEEFYSGVDETSARQRDNKSVKLEIPGKMKNTPEQILHRTGYTVSLQKCGFRIFVHLLRNMKHFFVTVPVYRVNRHVHRISLFLMYAPPSKVDRKAIPAARQSPHSVLTPFASIIVLRRIME